MSGELGPARDSAGGKDPTGASPKAGEQPLQPSPRAVGSEPLIELTTTQLETLIQRVVRGVHRDMFRAARRARGEADAGGGPSEGVAQRTTDAHADSGKENRKKGERRLARARAAPE